MGSKLALVMFAVVAISALQAAAAGSEGWGSVTCIPDTMSALERSEGRKSCAYDSKLGYKAIGVGYNLDDRSDERMREVRTILADWDKLYSGEECLNNVQINTLLTFDARRALLKAGERVKALDDWCCNAQAVFADIAFTHGQKELGGELEDTIREASGRKWREAAHALKKTEWCKRHEKICEDDARQLEQGCSSLGAAKEVREASMGSSGWGSVTCIPEAMRVMEQGEGRSRCAYDSKLGYRAIGVGYNLDDHSDERMRAVKAILADWDRLYSGEDCLNNVQIDTLLTFDARRALLKAGERMKALDDMCCTVQSVFADIAFTHGQKELGAELESTVKAASSRKWREAAEALKRTEWCHRNANACKDDARQLAQGCATYGERMADFFSSIL